MHVTAASEFAGVRRSNNPVVHRVICRKKQQRSQSESVLEVAETFIGT